MHEQQTSQANLDPATEAIRPYENLAKDYIAIHAALNDQSPESFAEELSLAKNKAISQRTPSENELLGTLNNIAEIGKGVTASGPSETKLQPWQEDYLASVEASMGVDKTLAELGDISYSEDAITNTLSEMATERSKQASNSTNPSEKSRLQKEALELMQFMSIRDDSTPEDIMDREQAADRYYEAHKLPGEKGRKGLELITQQIKHDAYFAKYIPEAFSRIQIKEQGLPHVNTQERPKSEEYNEHEVDLIEKANKITDHAMARAGRERLEKEYRSLQGQIQEERHRGEVNGPAAQKSRKIREIERNQQFTTRIPEDVPKIFEYLGLTSNEMKVKANKIAADLKDDLEKQKPGYIVSLTIPFDLNEITGQLEPGLYGISTSAADTYINEV